MRTVSEVQIQHSDANPNPNLLLSKHSGNAKFFKNGDPLSPTKSPVQLALGARSQRVHKLLWDPDNTCTESGCTTVDGQVVLDSNWHWVHEVNGYTNCYGIDGKSDGRAWD